MDEFDWRMSEVDCQQIRHPAFGLGRSAEPRKLRIEHAGTGAFREIWNEDADPGTRAAQQGLNVVIGDW